jgi:hypothetical protein
LRDIETRVRDRYEALAAQCATDEARLTRNFNVVASLRAGAFVLAALLAWFGATRNTPPLEWALVPFLFFLLLMFRHEIIVQERDRVRRTASYLKRGLARLDDQWAGTGDSGERFLREDHIYAGDLDILGKGSLFELLCSAETPSGKETLAAWLLAPADAATVRRRQEAVLELARRHELRLDLSVLGVEVAGTARGESLRVWGSAPPVEIPRGIALFALLVGLANAVTLIAATWFDLTPWAPVISIAIGMAVAVIVRDRVRTIVTQAERPARELDQLVILLGRLEREKWESPLLQELAERLKGHGTNARSTASTLRRYIGLLDSRRNQLFAPFGALLLWTTQLGLAVERWRVKHGGALSGWIDGIGEVEALVSLATYAAEHPADVMPQLVEGEARIDALELVHPLLPRSRAVANDVKLGADAPHAWIVSGSNMSGKSTLLRAVGVNAVLAQAGAPVSARRFALSPLAIGASFRAHDSLQQGQSRFYAEIARVRMTVDLLDGPTPLLFLLDELLSGTNSKDRAQGARAIVEHLVERGAIGMVTTHDLSLAVIADAQGSKMANVHFEDRLVAGELQFEYRLKPGVVERSNAMELMRAVGLPV